MSDEENPITPGILGLLAFLSIGGLLFLGFQAKIAGELVTNTPTNTICCTVETWQNSPIGYTQGNPVTQTFYCYPGQTMSGCCFEQASVFTDKPIKLLGVREGACEPGVPQQAYPVWIPY